MKNQVEMNEIEITNERSETIKEIAIDRVVDVIAAFKDWEFMDLENGFTLDEKMNEADVRRYIEKARIYDRILPDTPFHRYAELYMSNLQDSRNISLDKNGNVMISDTFLTINPINMEHEMNIVALKYGIYEVLFKNKNEWIALLNVAKDTNTFNEDLLSKKIRIECEFKDGYVHGVEGTMYDVFQYADTVFDEFFTEYFVRKAYYERAQVEAYGRDHLFNLTNIEVHYRPYLYTGMPAYNKFCKEDIERISNVVCLDDGKELVLCNGMKIPNTRLDDERMFFIAEKNSYDLAEYELKSVRLVKNMIFMKNGDIIALDAETGRNLLFK